MTFFVDTGASLTTILDGDAIRLGISFDKLKYRWVVGVSGPAKTYQLNDVLIGFKKINSANFVYDYLPTIDVVKPNKANKRPFAGSVIGMDLIQKLHIDYCNPRISITCKVHKTSGLDFIR